MKDISFVIPVYNEEESLDILYSEITENARSYDYEIIWIDDGSNDSSYNILSNICENDKNSRLIVFRKNFGKSAALQTGFDFVKGKIIVTMDADLQDDPKEIEKFIEKINFGADLVCGWKKSRKDPLSKIIPSRFFNFVTSNTFGLKLHDYNCGFKAYSIQLIKELDIYGEMHRYIPALALAKGFTIVELEVNHRERKFGKSKYGIERYLRGFLDLITVKLVTSYSHSPLYLFGGLGTGISFIGFVIAIYLTSMKFFFLEPLSKRPLLSLSVLLILIGVQMISIGLIGELVVNQNRKLKKNTKISIKEKLNLGE